MLRKEIVEKISKYFKLTEFEAERVYDDIFSIIINGVKEDNIVDIVNFGEFIVKFNNGKNGNGGNGSEYKKTVEFLASSQIEEELNPDLSSSKPPLTAQTEGGINKDESSSGSSIEDELRRKREEIIGKITGPVLQKPPEMNLEIPEGKKEESTQKESEAGKEKKEEPVKEEETAAPVSEPKEEEKPVSEPEKTVPSEEKAAEEKTAEEKAKETEKKEDFSSKSFSDYFSEVNEQKPAPEKKDVIPPSAVLLHNEITGGTGTTGDAGVPGGQYPQTEPEKQALQPVEEEAAEHVAGDNSYYIWYKDSESNPIDTQTLSYEYELLYQATKEAEYKSKLKIYVTSFILFFSIVLILLIFSPLLYKWFFSPAEIQKIENTQDAPDVSQQKAIPNVIPENNTTQQTQVQQPVTQQNVDQQQQQVNQNQADKQQTQTQANQNDIKQNQTEQKTVTPPVTKKDVKADEKNSLEQAGQQKSNQTQPPKIENNLPGVTRNSMGWMDEKLKVIYIKLENGKFTIQESAWDSNSKANKRISAVESFGIKGLKGNVVKADLGTKGTWYRVRFGEFSTLEEAHQKAVELRNKEGMRIAMMFVSFLMFA